MHVLIALLLIVLIFLDHFFLLFSCDLISVYNVVLELPFFGVCVCYHRFLACGYHSWYTSLSLSLSLYIYIYIYKRSFQLQLAGLLISNAFPLPCICTLFMVPDFGTYLCVDDFLSLLYLYWRSLLYLHLNRWTFLFVIFLFLVVAFSFWPRVVLWAYVVKDGLVLLNSTSFYLPVNLLISLSYLNKSLGGWNFLGFKFFSLITLNIFYHSLLAWRV